MNLSPVSISLSSFGADYVRIHGQASLAPLLRQSGASHMELREELFEHFDPASLAQAITAQGLTCVYSSPLELWQPGQATPNAQLGLALNNAAACGAIWLKVSLGYFAPGCDLQALGQALAGQPVRLLVENDQTAQGGRIDPLVRFFAKVEEHRLPVGMTFDIGNWQWQRQSVPSAALQLGRHVEYLHCKAVRSANGKYIAVPPVEDDLRHWSELLAHMQGVQVRAIEFPLQGDDLLAVTRGHVHDLARLGHSRLETAHG